MIWLLGKPSSYDHVPKQGIGCFENVLEVHHDEFISLLFREN